MIFAYLGVSVMLFILARYDLCRTDGSMIFAYLGVSVLLFILARYDPCRTGGS
jgi:hypothetical protein